MRAILLTGCLVILSILPAWAACERQKALPLPLEKHPEPPQNKERIALFAVKTEDEAYLALEKIHKFLKT